VVLRRSTSTPEGSLKRTIHPASEPWSSLVELGSDVTLRLALTVVLPMAVLVAVAVPAPVGSESLPLAERWTETSLKTTCTSRKSSLGASLTYALAEPVDEPPSGESPSSDWVHPAKARDRDKQAARATARGRNAMPRHGGTI
jgi:hypothetical protein